MTRALIAGADAVEIAHLVRVARTVLAPSCSYLSLEIDTSTTDPKLAWGTEGPVLRQLEIADAETGDVSAQPAVTMSSGTERPLGPDGDVAPAVLEAARAAGVDVIVTAVRPRGWLARVFSGLAELDLLNASEIPVLIVNDRQGVEDGGPR